MHKQWAEIGRGRLYGTESEERLQRGRFFASFRWPSGRGSGSGRGSLMSWRTNLLQWSVKRRRGATVVGSWTRRRGRESPNLTGRAKNSLQFC